MVYVCQKVSFNITTVYVKSRRRAAQVYFSDILARRKKLATKHKAGFAEALGLSGDAAEYFSLLMQKAHVKSGEEKDRINKKLSKLREKNLSMLVTDVNAEYFSSWKYPLVREYIVSRGYVSSVKEIRRALLHFRMSLNDIRRTVNKLVKWKMVVADGKSGVLTPGEPVGSVSYESMPHSVVNDVKRFFIESSIYAMETLPAAERHISTALREMSRKKYEEFCVKINELRFKRGRR